MYGDKENLASEMKYCRNAEAAAPEEQQAGCAGCLLTQACSFSAKNVTGK